MTDPLAGTGGDRPPILHDLLSFESYRKFFRTVAPMPNPGLNHPWQVWGERADGSGKWSSKCTATYQEAYTLVKKMHARPDLFIDIALVSRSVLFPEPGQKIVKGRGKAAYTLFIPDFLGLWDRHRYEWCKRCRRPTVFKTYPINHRALTRAVVLTLDNPYRCYYCGARQCFAGDTNDR